MFMFCSMLMQAHDLYYRVKRVVAAEESGLLISDDDKEIFIKDWFLDAEILIQLLNESDKDGEYKEARIFFEDATNIMDRLRWCEELRLKVQD